MSPPPRRFIGPVLAGVAVLLTLVVQLLGVRVDRRSFDEADNLAFAYNLAGHGIFSRSIDGSRRSSHFREPLYPAVLGACLWLGADLPESVGALWEAVHGRTPEARERTSRLLLVNLILLQATALCGAAWIRRRTGWLGWAGLTYLLIALGSHQLELAYQAKSESLAALLLLLASLSLERGGREGWTRRSAGVTGLLLAALALTKALYLYFIPLAACYVVWATRRSRKRSSTLTTVAIFILAAALPVVGWMARNAATVGAFELSARGGAVLLMRANLNDHAEELPAFVWLFLPPGPRYRETMHRNVSPAVRLAIFQNGRWSYKTRAYTWIREQSVERGRDRVAALARAEALRRIRQAPLAHLKMSVAVAYRGLFVATGLGPPPPDEARVATYGERYLGVGPTQLGLSGLWLAVVVSLALWGSFFLVANWAWLRGDGALIGLTLPTLFTYGLLVGATYFLPRFALPTHPILAICLVLCLARLGSGRAWSPPHRPAA